MYEFYNCLTIYYLYSLRDILWVCRSDYRSGFMNCVGILYNFGVVGMVGVWWKCEGFRWYGFYMWCESGTHTQDLAAGT